ncbi:hypothetical protein [Peribacillus acanthi]|uniref:hypothetical protein n=1 Tax=Peribacillus acanthi TaxID=2171554 RepID=UPI000D3E36C9|nr:hypothetical protein [Peribacillus acanthi]
MLDDKKMIEEMIKFDDAFPDEVFAVGRKPGEARVKVRALWNYCQEKGGIEPKDLTVEEMEQFFEY